MNSINNQMFISLAEIIMPNCKISKSLKKFQIARSIEFFKLKPRFPDITLKNIQSVYFFILYIFYYEYP